MDRQRGGTAGGQRIGQCRTGARDVEAAAFDFISVRREPAHESAAVEKRAGETSVRLSPDGIDDPGVTSIGLKGIAQPSRFLFVRRSYDEAVEVEDRTQAGPTARKIVATDVNRQANRIDVGSREKIVERHRRPDMRDGIADNGVKPRRACDHGRSLNYLVRYRKCGGRTCQCLQARRRVCGLSHSARRLATCTRRSYGAYRS